MKLSAATVNGYTKSFESWGLIRRQEPKLQSEKGKRQRTIFYELTEESKLRLEGVKIPEITCRAHHFGIKYRISQSGSPAKDKRTGYDHSFYMRGGSERKVYWYSEGELSCTVTWHPGTLMVWMDKGQMIKGVATIEDAIRVGYAAVEKAKEQFVAGQDKFNIRIVADKGTRIGKPHLGFNGKDGTTAAQQGVTKDEWWIDHSQKEVAPDEYELETMDEKSGTLLDQTIQFSQQFPQMLNPLQQDISAVKAMVQGGITMNQQYEQMINFMTKALNEMAAMRQEIRELRNANRQI